MNTQEFILWETRSRDAIDVKRCYVDIAGDLVSGVLLSQIIYWHLPDDYGASKLRVHHDDYEWLAKKREDWWNECRISPKQFDRSVDILEKRSLVVTKLYRFDGSPTKHVRINWDGLFKSLESLPDNDFTQRSKSKFTSESILPKGQNPNLPMGEIVFDESAKTITKTPAKITAKKKEKISVSGENAQELQSKELVSLADIAHTESAGTNVSGDPLRDAAACDNKTNQGRWQNVNELIESVMDSILPGDPIPRTVLEEARSRRWTFPWRSRDRHNMYGTCNPALVEFICKERASWKVGCKWESKISGVVATIQAKEQTCAGWEELLIYLERMKQQTSFESHAIPAPILPTNTVSVPPETNKKPTEDQLRHQELFAKERAAIQAKLKEKALAKEQARAKQRGSGKTSTELEAEVKALRQAELQAALGQGGI